MSLWETLGTMTSPGGLFHGYTPAEIWAMLETLYLGQCMRRTTDGYLVNVTQRGMFEDTVRQRYGLTNAQYVTITQLYDQGEAGPCFAASGAHLEMPIPGIPGYVGRYLAVDKTTCCNGTLKVTWMLTVVYERARSYTARHVVKRCVVPGGCRSTYYHNKRTVPAEVDGAPGRWHVFYPFSDGEIPLFITNKSGRSAISSALLTDSAIKICKLGAGFASLATIYSRTIGRDAHPLAGDVLLQIWLLFAVLKHRQALDPFMWLSPNNHPILAQAPCEVGVWDEGGQLQGANHWPGLVLEVGDIVSTYWEHSAWGGGRHACDDCWKLLEIDGEMLKIHCMAADGLTARALLR